MYNNELNTYSKDSRAYTNEFNIYNNNLRIYSNAHYPSNLANDFSKIKNKPPFQAPLFLFAWIEV